MNRINLIYPYYNSAGILLKQLENIAGFPQQTLDHLQVIVIDDCSPHAPALPQIRLFFGDSIPGWLNLYRVLVDIPWNQHGCRNLGAKIAPDGWLFMSDIDHMLPIESMNGLMQYQLDPEKYYTLQRVTAVKKEDGNFKYDLMTDAFGKPKPHPNTYFLTKDKYWQAGGYDEDYCGTYGGDGPFMRNLNAVAEKVHFQDLVLIRWTRDVIPDASQPPEYREKYRALYRKLFEKKGTSRASKPVKWVRFKWERLI